MTDNNRPRARLYYLFRANHSLHGNSWTARIPASLFAIPVGLFGLADAWRRAATYGWSFAEDVDQFIAKPAAAILALALLLYAYKAKRHWPAVLHEASHPVQSSLQALLPLSLLLAVVHFGDMNYGIWLAITLLALTLTVVIGYRVIAMLENGQLPDNAVTPVLYLPVVGGALVGSMALTTLQYTGWAAMLFGTGLAGWALLEARILGRLFEKPMPKLLRSTMGVELVPPVITTLAAAMIWPGLPGKIMAVGIGIALAPFAGVLARYRWWSEVPFSLGFWSFSFPLAAFSSAAIEALYREGWPTWIGHAVLLVASAAIGFLAIRTLILLLQGKLLAAE